LLATVSHAPYCRGGVRHATGDKTATRFFEPIYAAVPSATSQSPMEAPPPFVIPRGCDFLIFVVLAHPTRRFFKTPTRPSSLRSASQIYRLTEGFWRAVEGPRGWLLADALRSFPAAKPERNQKSHSLRAKPRDLQFHSTPNQCCRLQLYQPLANSPWKRTPRFVIPTGA